MRSALVLVTRPDGERDPLVAALQAAGFRVAAVPTVALEPVADRGPLDAAADGTAAWDWVIVTSRRGVEALGEAVRRRDPEGSLARWPTRWAAVGDGTARALGREGLLPELVPADARGAAIAAQLAAQDDVRGRRILLPRASAADRELPERLRALGAYVEEVVAYTTVVGPAASVGPIATALADPDLGLAVVASASAAEGLRRLAEVAGPAAASRVRALPLVSIGPSTSAATRRLGLHLVAEARMPTVGDLVAAVVAVLAAGETRAPTPTGTRR